MLRANIQCPRPTGPSSALTCWALVATPPCCSLFAISFWLFFHGCHFRPRNLRTGASPSQDATSSSSRAEHDPSSDVASFFPALHHAATLPRLEAEDEMPTDAVEPSACAGAVGIRVRLYRGRSWSWTRAVSCCLGCQPDEFFSTARITSPWWKRSSSGRAQQLGSDASGFCPPAPLCSQGTSDIMGFRDQRDIEQVAAPPVSAKAVKCSDGLDLPVVGEAGR